MKCVLFCISILALVFVSTSCSSTTEHSVQSEPLVGKVEPKRILADYPEFKVGYDNYSPSKDEVLAVQSLAGKSLLVMFGTWCHDSEREIPRLLKLLDKANVGLADFSLHGLNYNKQEPNGLHRQYALRYSPTIILLDGGKELGRITEKPNSTLGEDLARFLK